MMYLDFESHQFDLSDPKFPLLCSVSLSARLTSPGWKLEKLVFLFWPGLGCDFYASQGGKQEMSPVRTTGLQDYTTVHTTLTWSHSVSV